MIDIISGIISPTLGLLCAAGIVKGLLALFSFIGWLPETSGAYQIWYAVGDGFYYFLPIVLGYSAAKKFQMNEFTGMALGAALVYPAMVNIMGGEVLGTILSGTAFEMSFYTTFFGIPVIMPASGYTSSVVPIILSVMAGAKVEKWAKKHVPSVVKLFMVPFCVIFVMVPLTYLLIGPVTSVLCSMISVIFETVFAIPIVGGLIAGALIGGFWQVLVMFGLHWGLMPLALINFANVGYDMILSPFFCVSFATTFTVLAIMLKTKQKKMKEMAVSAFISGLFGVTEPAIYGITLPKKKPFILSCVGGAVGGAFTGLMGARSYQLGGLGLFGLPNYIDAHGGSGMYSVIIICISVVIASAISFVLTFLTYKDEEEETVSQPVVEKSKSTELQQETTGEGIIAISSPLTGEVKPIRECSDEVFATEVLGKGVLIEPQEGKVFAPFDGKISCLFDTYHALGLTSDRGTELLIHVGMDTVSLNGEGFTPYKKTGDRIRKGDLLLEFDMDLIRSKGLSLSTPVIVSNVGDYKEIRCEKMGNIQKNDLLMKLE